MIFEGTNQVLRMMIAFQGLRSLQRGELGTIGPARLAGAHATYASEREELEHLTAVFSSRCQAALVRHGEQVREAQFTLHRLSDMAAALFITAAVLARASASEQRGSADERER